jgi:homoserine/homoserine lactone efflux protein
MKTELFFLYLATWSVVALSPGPAVMCAMSLATRYDLRAALVGIAGLQLAHVVFFGCVGFGLAALLATATTAFTVLRVAGAIYLMYLGLRLLGSSFRSKERAETGTAGGEETAPARRWRRHRIFLQGFAIQVTNPKALLFMSALLPQFIRAGQPVGPQLGILLAVTIAVDSLVLGGYACLACRGARMLRVSGVTIWLERVFGAVLVLFGVRLLAARK